MIDRAYHPLLPRAISAAEVILIRLDAMPDNLAATVRANGRKLVYSAFEAVEHMPISSRDDVERQIVIVAAYFAARHRNLLCPGGYVVNQFKKP
jgi:hypothetical protein